MTSKLLLKSVNNIHFAYDAKGKKMAYWLSHMPCRATFEKSFRRNEHVERCKRIFNCGEVCGKSFKSKQALTVHFNGTHGKLNVWDCLDYRCFRETQGRQLATRRCMSQLAQMSLYRELYRVSNLLVT